MSEAKEKLSREEVANILAGVMASAESKACEDQARILNDLNELAQYITSLKEDVGNVVKPREIRERHIASANDELDAVVEATAEAANRIMDAAEIIQSVASELNPAQAARLDDATTQIYEACNFQDISGQRITKVIDTIRVIDDRINDILAGFGLASGEGGAAAGPDTEAPVISDDSDLLNGPALTGEGVDQDEIDRLLASFD